MKTYQFMLLGSILSLLVFSSCQRDIKDLPPSVNTANEESMGRTETLSVSSSSSGPYSVTLIGPNQVNGKWVYIWKVQNTNPGNGSNGTAQGLSHWGFPMPAGGCFNLSAVSSASYSANGTSWTNFNPTIQIDPSSCINVPVFKFDFGTNGSAPSYFRLILNSYFNTGQVTGYYKSGRKTGCGTFLFQGLSCEEPYN